MYAATMKDEGNAADGCFSATCWSKASTPGTRPGNSHRRLLVDTDRAVDQLAREGDNQLA